MKKQPELVLRVPFGKRNKGIPAPMFKPPDPKFPEKVIATCGTCGETGEGLLIGLWQAGWRVVQGKQGCSGKLLESRCPRHGEEMS